MRAAVTSKWGRMTSGEDDFTEGLGYYSDAKLARADAFGLAVKVEDAVGSELEMALVVEVVQGFVDKDPAIEAATATCSAADEAKVRVGVHCRAPFVVGGKWDDDGGVVGENGGESGGYVRIVGGWGGDGWEGGRVG